jgi:ribosomal protein S18 acetylase RimI-like enzyme
MDPIIRLDPVKYKGFKYESAYLSEGCYEVVTKAKDGFFAFELTKVKFPKPLPKRSVSELRPDYIEDAEDFGIFDGSALVAILEIAVEKWDNRLRIWELWVEEAHRHQGLGGRLLEYAKEAAKTLGCRAVVLETQSCNLAAIACYSKHGFRFIGLDTQSYSNEDLEKQEVRFEMGLTL